jgi:serine/threonine-protein kinase
VGAVLYRMVTGNMPYEGNDPGSILAKLLSGPPPRPRAIVPELPIAVEAVIQRAMARDPDERPESALALEAALAAIDPNDPSPLVISSVGERSSELAGRFVLPSSAPGLRKETHEEIEWRARRARPLAALVATTCALADGAGAASAMAAAGALLAQTEAERALARALSIVGGLAIATAAAIGVGRTLRERWSSAPAVEYASARFERALVSALVVLGATLLGTMGLAAVEGTTVAPSPLALLGALAVAAVASFVALRLRRT